MALHFILADRQDATRAGLQYIIGQHFRGEGATITAAPGAKELMAALQASPCAVVVLDYARFDLRSVADVINMRQHFPQSAWLMFSNELSEEALRRFACEEGVSIVLKEDAEEEITHGLIAAAHNRSYICRQVAALVAEAPRSTTAPPAGLTHTELEILKLIAHGKSVKEIAQERCASPHTIITHKKNIFRKLEVNNVYEATKYALHAGLVDLMEYYI